MEPNKLKVHFSREYRYTKKKKGRGGRVKRGLEIRCASDEEEKGLRITTNLEICVDEEEKGRGPLTRTQTYQVLLSLSKLGRNGLCVAKTM